MGAKKLDYSVDSNGCFICTSHQSKREHAGHVSHTIGRGRKRHLLHRFIYTEMFGEIPKGMVVRHKCDNSACINPEHLELGTPKENSLDMVNRGRNRNGPRKLDEQKAKEIRELIEQGMKQRDIAKLYGVVEGTISHVKNEKFWTTENIQRRESAGRDWA